MGLKNDPTIYYLQGTHFISWNNKLRVKEWKRIVHANWSQKGAGMAITSDKVGFKSVKVKRSKARHYILIKSSI